MPRTTLYNCFKDGRRRIDSDAVIEIALALGLAESARDRWVTRLRLARSAADGAAVVAVRDPVPSSVPAFAGRDVETATITHMLATDAGAPWISGMAGMGKTQLALRALEGLDGPRALFLDLRGFHAELPPVDPFAAQGAILRHFEIAGPGDPVQRTQRIHQALQGSNRVLLLDDAAGIDQVTAILGDDPQGHVIVTSRARLEERSTGSGTWRHIALQGVGAQETAAIVRAIAATGAVEALPHEIDAAAPRMAEITGGLPLAVSLIGARLATHPEWSLHEHLELATARLARSQVDDDLLQQLALSYKELPAEAARLLRAFADLPLAELDAEVAAVLLGTSTEHAIDLLAQLSGFSLVIRRQPHRYALHSMMRAYGRSRAEETDPPRRRAEVFARAGRFLAERVWGAYAVIAESMDEQVRRTDFTFPDLEWDERRAGAWLTTWLPSLLALAHAAPERGHPDVLFRLSEGLSWWMNLAGHRLDALRLHEAAADAAAEIGDADALSMASLDAGQLLVLEDEPEQAQEHFERATRLVANAGLLADPGLAGLIQNMSAVIDMRHGRLSVARDGFRRAVEIHEERDEEKRLMAALVNLGVVLHTAGEFDEEKEVIERALRIAEARGDRLFWANLLINRGGLRVELGDLVAARDDAAAAVAEAESFGHAYLIAAGEIVIAEARRREGALETAMGHGRRALEFARSLRIGMVIAEALLVIAAIHADQDEAVAARPLLDEVDTLLRDGVDHVMRGTMWSIRARISSDPLERTRFIADAREQFDRVGSFHAAALAEPAEDHLP